MAESQQSPIPAFDVDEEGFLVQPETWTREVAQALARDEVEGELTEDHWNVIDHLRRYHLEFKNVPPDRMLARDTGLSVERINELFPSGVTAGACRVAGIPRAGVCSRRFHSRAR